MTLQFIVFSPYSNWVETPTPQNGQTHLKSPSLLILKLLAIVGNTKELIKGGREVHFRLGIPTRSYSHNASLN